ncbi:MAG: hypothetical protein C7B45_01215 [Sulfobacillus acidophilus]|uniref:Uncharacterized protein n=1 Tax=Sulfobacillus acidophilus TaxID=53633 RepID=A0A2T2WNX3_9FIRM|nr:MAG: hypothetical protein C7B45_01215 [Sulfobacillus acidophilus]
MRHLWKQWRMRQGQALVMVALSLPLLLGMGGVGLTVGTIYFAQAKLQNAVDAAALAGAKALSVGATGAPASAASYITANDPQATNVVISSIPSTTPDRPTIVQASASTQVPGTFAALFGYSTFSVAAQAQAAASPGQPFNFAVFQGDPNPSNQELLLSGNVSVDSTGSTPAAAVHSNNNLELKGHVSVDGTCGGDPSVSIIGQASCAAGTIEPAAQIAMPQWTVPEAMPTNPTTIGSPTNATGMTISGSTTTDGNYVVYGNLTIDGNTTVNGNYVVEDGNIIITGNASVSGSLVTFGGGIYLAGNVTQSNGGTLALAAFTSNDDLSSTALQPAPNDPPDPGSIVLKGRITVNSALYAPDSYIDLKGNVTVNGAVVGYLVNLNGNVSVTYSPTVIGAIPVQQVTLIQ